MFEISTVNPNNFPHPHPALASLACHLFAPLHPRCLTVAIVMPPWIHGGHHVHSRLHVFDAVEPQV